MQSNKNIKRDLRVKLSFNNAEHLTKLVEDSGMTVTQLINQLISKATIRAKGNQNDISSSTKQQS